MRYYLPDWAQSLMLVLVFLAGSLASSVLSLAGIESLSVVYAVSMLFPLGYALIRSWQAGRSGDCGYVLMDDFRKGGFRCKAAPLLLAVCMVFALCATAFADDVELPREETLYFAGQQWGTVNSWNVIGANQNNSMAIAGNAGGYRTLMFETLYMYNPLDGSLTPLLADGDYAWNDDMTVLTVKLNGAAKWSDGTAVTAADVARTFEIGCEIGNQTGTTYGAYIDKVVAVDDATVEIDLALNEAGQAKNPLLILDFLVGTPIAQAAWIDKVVERNNGDAQAILNDAGEDVVWCGPYTKYYTDDQKVVLIRDDNYWGQDASMWGKLPVPKYIAHVIYADNPAGDNALKAGEVDVCQQFISNIQDLWLKDNLPISTYFEEYATTVAAGNKTPGTPLTKLVRKIFPASFITSRHELFHELSVNPDYTYEQYLKKQILSGVTKSIENSGN